jgi:hypothetical protein
MVAENAGAKPNPAVVIAAFFMKVRRVVIAKMGFILKV